MQRAYGRAGAAAYMDVGTPRSQGRSSTSLCSTALEHPVHRMRKSGVVPAHMDVGT
ncbi:MAG: hypothetical protein OEL79_08505 [Chromatiales bacterium]|nr:hypothetical protein [Chromatiales bacterium]